MLLAEFLMINSKQPCPSGTFNPNSRGQSEQTACQLCLAGMACVGSGLAWPDQTCKAGYYCAEGASSDEENECQEGHYCPPGASEPKPCPVGYYQPDSGKDFCLPCPSGSICPSKGLQNPQECPEGSYCLGTSSGNCLDQDGRTYELGQLDPIDKTQLIRCGCKNKNELCAPCVATCSEERAPTPCPRGR